MKTKYFFWNEFIFWFFAFFFKCKRKPNIFNTGFVSYNISLQPNIMQNYWKNMRENHKYFEMTLGIFLDIYIYIYIYNFYFYYIIKYKLGWTRLSHPGWAKTGLTWLSRVGLIGDPTNPSFFWVGWTQPRHMS